MAELRVVMNHNPQDSSGREPVIWMSFTALDFSRMAGGAPFLVARWRWRHTWVRWS